MTGDVNTWSKTPGTNSSADPNINFAEGQNPSSLNDSARVVMAAIANDRDDTRGALALTGGTTAYLVTTNAVNAAYFNGLEVWGKVNATSTGSVTLNVDGLGAKKVYDNGSTVATQLGSGGLTINEHAGFQYDSAADGGVGGFIKISNPGIASTAIAANSITNAQLVNVATSTIKGRVTAATGSPEDLTMAQVVGLTAGMSALAANTVALTDQLPIYDISATTGKSATPDKILETLNLLTEDTSPALSTDFVLTYDTSAATVKKVKPSNLATSTAAPDVILEDQKTAGTSGGTFTAATDTTRTLNTEVRDPSGYCTLASNQFTLTAGTYYIQAQAPASTVSGHQIWLYNVTGATELLTGSSANTQNTIGASTHSFIDATFTVAAAQALEIRHRCGSTRATDGLGPAANVGHTECYTRVKLWKIA